MTAELQIRQDEGYSPNENSTQMKKWLKSVQISQNLRHLRAKKSAKIINFRYNRTHEIIINSDCTYLRTEVLLRFKTVNMNEYIILTINFLAIDNED
jgi:hypothetical protein